MERKLSNWLDGYMLYTENSEPPLLFRLWTGIMVIASALQRKVYIRWDDKIYPNFYTVLVAQSSLVRKGTAMRPGYALLSQLGVKLSAEAVTREALIQELGSSTTSVIDPVTGLVTLHSSLTVFSPELTVFLGYRNADLIANLCNWYDCPERWHYKTKNSGSNNVTGVWFNLFGATTPDLLRATLPQDAVGSGLTARIMFVYETEPGKIVVFPFSSHSEQSLFEELSVDLEQISMLQGEFRFTPDWMDKYAVFYEELRRDPPFKHPNLMAYNGRRQYQLLKLCMVVSASRSNDLIITGEDFDTAHDLLTRTEKNMPKLFSGVGKSPTAETMSKVMTAIAASGEMNLETLMRRFYHDADKDTLSKILATLETMGEIERVVRGSTIAFRWKGKTSVE